MSKKDYKPTADEPLRLLNEDAAVYEIMGVLRRGISFSDFFKIMQESFFNLQEWAEILHLDTRTLQRYRVSNLTFAPLQSEKILEIKLLTKLGNEVFGESHHFDVWLRTTNVALGGFPPKDLLDNAFGIAIIKDELIKIQYGIFA